MKKRSIALILAAIISLMLFGCGWKASENTVPVTTAVVTQPATTAPSTSDLDETQSTAQSQITPLLYKVSDTDGNVVWLFGSIHVGREDFDPLPRYIWDAYESSDALAVEADIVAFEGNMQEQIRVLQGMLYLDGTTIKDHIPADIYEKAVQALTEAGQYNQMLDYYVPSMWTTYLESVLYLQEGVDLELGIDRILINHAKQTGKELLEVESVEFQYNMMADFSQELQIYLLEDALWQLENKDEVMRSLDQMQDIWASGDEAAFSAYLEEEGTFENEQEALLYKEYTDAMIASRNTDMTKYAQDALASGKELFICVGAAHVVGEGAMAQQLRDLGYTVQIIR